MLQVNRSLFESLLENCLNALLFGLFQKDFVLDRIVFDVLRQYLLNEFRNEVTVDSMTITYSKQRNVVHYKPWHADERVLIDLRLILEHAGPTADVVPANY